MATAQLRTSVHDETSIDKGTSGLLVPQSWTLSVQEKAGQSVMVVNMMVISSRTQHGTDTSFKAGVYMMVIQLSSVPDARGSLGTFKN